MKKGASLPHLVSWDFDVLGKAVTRKGKVNVDVHYSLIGRWLAFV
jgi:hypothetical protein